MYDDLKLLHLVTVGLSISLFLLRAGLSLHRAYADLPRWLRVVPHVNDSLLLTSAVSMATMSQQFPFTHDWLTAKLVALVAYIICGSIALKRARSVTARLIWASVALVLVGYIVAVALTRSPTPWLWA